MWDGVRLTVAKVGGLAVGVGVAVVLVWWWVMCGWCLRGFTQLRGEGRAFNSNIFARGRLLLYMTKGTEINYCTLARQIHRAFWSDGLRGLAGLFVVGRLLLLHLLLELGRTALGRLERRGVRGVERDGPPADLGEGRGRVRGEDVEEGLEGVVEHDLVVLPRVHGPHLRGDVEGRRGVVLALREDLPGVQLEVVVEGDGLLAGLGDEVDADLDFELAPSVVVVSEMAQE